MFEDNWYLFLLVVMVAFVSDGDVSKRESAVMLGILAALAFTNSADTTSNSTMSTQSTTNCFCNKTL